MLQTLVGEYNIIYNIKSIITLDALLPLYSNNNTPG